MRGVIEAGSEAMMTLTEWVMAVSPIGIAALIASTVASTGLEIFSALIWFVLTVAVALGFHVFVSMPTLVYTFTKRNPYQYMRAMMPALLTGFQPHQAGHPGCHNGNSRKTWRCIKASD